MKNNQVVKLLGAITETGKLARDMYDLDIRIILILKGSIYLLDKWIINIR